MLTPAVTQMRAGSQSDAYLSQLVRDAEVLQLPRRGARKRNYLPLHKVAELPIKLNFKLKNFVERQELLEVR